MLICPNCKRPYSSPILVCPQCRQELLPPSTIKLQRDHPDLAQAGPLKKPIFSHGPEIGKQDETYVEIHRGSLQEAKEVVRLLEKEAIPCRIQRVEVLPRPHPLEWEDPMADSEKAVVQVPTSQLEKAHALLDWEASKQDEDQKQDKFLAADQEETILCPDCEAEVAPDDAVCPECGLELELDGDETDEEEYFCSSCGEACDPGDPQCPNCGARFDH